MLQDRHAPEESGPLAKAASGALEAVPLIRVTNLTRIARLAGGGVPLHRIRRRLIAGPGSGAAARPSGARTRRRRHGLRRLVRETCDVIVRIPIAPGVDSLNLAAAAAVRFTNAAEKVASRPVHVEGRRSSDGRATAL